MTAHVGGLPLEELVPALAAGASTTYLTARGWLLLRLRSRQESGT